MQWLFIISYSIYSYFVVYYTQPIHFECFPSDVVISSLFHCILFHLHTCNCGWSQPVITFTSHQQCVVWFNPSTPSISNHHAARRMPFLLAHHLIETSSTPPNSTDLMLPASRHHRSSSHLHRLILYQLGGNLNLRVVFLLAFYFPWRLKMIPKEAVKWLLSRVWAAKAKPEPRCPGRASVSPNSGTRV